MKVGVLTDIHGNLPALRAVLAAMEREGCDAIYHTGDAIAIGPYPAECLDLLLNTPRLHLVMGNHDAWFAHGLPQPWPWTGGELEHQHWVHSSLDVSLKPMVARWPYVIEENLEGVRVTFLHYGLRESGSEFASVVKDPTADDLERMYARYGSDIVFYGHQHTASDLSGRARYVSLAAAGCSVEPVARFVILTCAGQGCTLEQHAAPYDDADLFREFERRGVPERELIRRVFFGRQT